MTKGKTNNPNGRPKGAPNKATRDIRDLLQRKVDWEERIDNLKRMASVHCEICFLMRGEHKDDHAPKWVEGNMKAEEILWQYGHGKPTEIQIAPVNLQTQENKPIQHEHTHSLDAGNVKNLMDLAAKFAKR